MTSVAAAVVAAGILENPAFFTAAAISVSEFNGAVVKAELDFRFEFNPRDLRGHANVLRFSNQIVRFI